MSDYIRDQYIQMVADRDEEPPDHYGMQEQLEAERQQHILGMLKKVSQGMGTLNLADALAAEFGLSTEWKKEIENAHR